MRKTVSVFLFIAIVVSIPSVSQARGEGWTDVMWASIYGTAFGTILGGASLVLYPSQAEADAHIYNIAIGAGAGLVGGIIYGTIIGWPKSEKAERAQFIFIPPVGEENSTTLLGFRRDF